jgi:hypothetical protein
MALLERGLALCAFGEQQQSLQQSYLASVNNRVEKVMP